MRLIDADVLEREGWSLSRDRQVDAKTMVYETKKPTEFPTVEPEPEVMSDGTLHITVDIDISKADRILLSQKGTHYGNLYYVDDDEPKRKTGKWIYHPDWETDGECGYECSECGMGSDVNYNYCMKCGAKMEEESERFFNGINDVLQAYQEAGDPDDLR